jgi:GAF domain-containing protein
VSVAWRDSSSCSPTTDNCSTLVGHLRTGSLTEVPSTLQNGIVANPGNLTRQLASAADALGPVLMPVEQRTQLVDLCTIIRLAVGAASVSIARLDGNELLYEAAEGAGAHNVIGLRLPSNSGIAGYVAHTGQSLVVDEVQADPRFAREVAERVGYVPTSMLAVPVVDENDQVVGVISVLDRTAGVGDPLAVTSASARVAAPLLALSGTLARLGPLLVRAVADAVEHDETTLGRALRRLADDLPPDDAEIATFAALMAELRLLPAASQQAVGRIVREAIDLAASRRRW